MWSKIARNSGTHLAVKQDVDSWIMVSRLLSSFNSGTVFNIDCTERNVVRCQNIKLTRELRGMYSLKDCEFFEFYIGGAGVFKTYVLFPIEKDRFDIVQNMNKALVSDVLLPALKFLRLNSKTLQHNVIPEKQGVVESVKLFHEDWENFASNVKSYIYRLHDNVFFYRARHGISSDYCEVIEEMMSASLNLEEMAILQLHLGMEFNIENETVAFDLHQAKKLFKYESYLEYPKFFYPDVGQFSGFVNSAQQSHVSYVQGYDTKFHILPVKKSAWPIFLTKIFRNFDIIIQQNHRLSSFAKKVLENRLRFETYVKSATMSNGARIEAVVSFLQYEKICFTDMKKIIEEWFTFLENVTFEKELLVVSTDNAILNSVLLKIYDAMCKEENQSRDDIYELYKHEVIMRNFLDSSDLYNDGELAKRLVEHEDNYPPAFNFKQEMEIDSDKLRKFWKCPYPKFVDHVVEIIESIPQKGKEVGGAQLFFRILGNHVIGLEGISHSVSKKVKEEPENIFLEKNFKFFKSEGVYVIGTISPKEVVDSLLKPETNFAALSLCCVGSDLNDYSNDLLHFVKQSVEVVPCSIILNKNKELHWMQVQTLQQFLMEPSIVFPPNLSPGLTAQKNLQQYAKKWRKFERGYREYVLTRVKSKKRKQNSDELIDLTEDDVEEMQPCTSKTVIVDLSMAKEKEKKLSEMQIVDLTSD